MDRPNRRRQRFRLERGRQLAGSGANFVDREPEQRIGGHRRHDLGELLTFQFTQGIGRQARIIGIQSEFVRIAHGDISFRRTVHSAPGTPTGHSRRNALTAVWIKKPTLPIESRVMRLISL